MLALQKFVLCSSSQNKCNLRFQSHSSFSGYRIIFPVTCRIPGKLSSKLLTHKERRNIQAADTRRNTGFTFVNKKKFVGFDPNCTVPNFIGNDASF